MDKFKRDERRARVYDLTLSGMSLVSIATMLQVHRNTVAADLKMMRKEGARRVKLSDPNAELGEQIRFYEEISRKAMSDYALSDEKSQMRAGYLNTALRCRELIMKLMMDSGMVPKAADKVQMEGLYVVQGRDIRLMGAHELEDMIAQLLAKLGDKPAEPIAASSAEAPPVERKLDA